MKESRKVAAHLSQLNIICAAILAGVAVFAGVVWYLSTSGTLPGNEMATPSWLGTLLNGFALLMIASAHLVPGVFTRPGREAPEEKILRWHRQTVIVGFAMREAAAITALVGGLVTGRFPGALTMAVLAVASMVLAWPRAEQLSRFP